MVAIWKREFKSYMTSMIGWVFMAAILVFIGLYFYVYNIYYGYPYFSYALNGTQFIFMLAIPILTMRSFAEERRSKTDQLLLTSPVSVTGIVLGKYLAMISVFALDMILICVCPLIIKMYGISYPAVDYTSILVYFLMGCSYIAICMFISSLTESQIIAAVASYAALILLYMMNGFTSMIPASASASAIGFGVLVLAAALIYYALTKNWFAAFAAGAVGAIAISALYMYKPGIFENAIPKMIQGLVLTTGFTEVVNTYVVTASGIARYLSVIFFFCFLTAQSVQKRRWS